MAKILVLNGSPHKSASTTMAVTNAFVKGMCEGGEYESEIINISDLNVTPCMGCLSCWARTEGECVIKNDDMPAVKKRIEEADIIIESYPLYFFGMPGQMELLTASALSLLTNALSQQTLFQPSHTLTNICQVLNLHPVQLMSLTVDIELL